MTRKEYEKTLKNLESSEMQKYMEKIKLINAAECYEDAKDIIDTLEKLPVSTNKKTVTKKNSSTFQVKDKQISL